MFFRTSPVFDQLTDHPSVHCATLTELPSGRLLSAWFGGSQEMASDVVILAADIEPQSEQWSVPRVIAQVPGYSLGQPVFLPHSSGELWLFFDVIVGKHWRDAQPHWQRSVDDGISWSQPQQLFDYPGFMFRSRPCRVGDRIILPAYDENTWQSRMLISDDEGASWRIGTPIDTPQGNIHATLVQHEQGLLAYLRTGDTGGVIWRMESADRGDTWSTPSPTQFPNPNSGIDLLRLHSGGLVLAYNHSDRLRTPLCLVYAADGERFTQMQTLENEEGEFSYPTLFQDGRGFIHCVYTYRREHIQHACFDEEWLRQGAMISEPIPV